MTWQLPPETAAKHRKMRFRSGVRAWAVVALFLLMIFLLYCGTVKVLHKIARFRWEKAITAPIDSGDSHRAAELLTQCRRQAPFLQKKSYFIGWEKAVFGLLQAEKHRRQQFRKGLDELKNKLQTHPAADLPWQTELIRLAGLASTPAELAEVREQEAHCQALTKLRMIKSAKTAQLKLAELEKSIGKLTTLQNQRRWQEYKELHTRITVQLTDTAMRYPEIPEIGKRARELKKLLEQLSAAAVLAETAAYNELAAYRKIQTLTTAESLRTEIENFLEKYPQSLHKAELVHILNDLKLLQIPFARSLKKILAEMAENNRSAKNFYTAEFEKIVADELQFGTFELIIKQKNNRIIRFETLSKSLFVKQSDGKYHIKFTALDNRRVKAVFSADGSGIAECAEQRWQGQLIYGNIHKALPPSVKQYTLLKIQQYLQNIKEENFPLFLCFLHQETTYKTFQLLPAAVKAKLQQLLHTAEKMLKAPAMQFIFTRDIIQQCSENTPVFAGTVKFEKNETLYTPAAITPDPRSSTTLWQLDSRNKPYFFKSGKLQNGQLYYSGKARRTDRKFCITAIPANGADYAKMISNWQRSAQKYRLKIPPLPEFLTDFINQGNFKAPQ